MNNKIDDKLEELEKMKIDLDTTFKFSCNQCGKCCINRDDILLTPLDVYCLSKELKMKPADMIKEYADVYIGKDSDLPIVCLRPRGSIKRCRFLKDRKCSVHNAKPVVCALFPIGRLFEAGANGKIDCMNAEIQYIFTNPNCGTGETHTVREWLDMFNIPVDDIYFRKWGKAFMDISDGVIRVKKKMHDEESLQLFNNLLYLIMYVKYDTKQEFMPQFENNIQEIMSLISQITAK